MEEPPMPPMPIIPVFGAGLRGETCRVRRCGRTARVVAYATVALERERRALVEKAAGEVSTLVEVVIAALVAASKAIVEG